MSKSYNIGPGAIAEPGATNGPAFCLSATEWLSIQTYVKDALALPTDLTQFRNSLGPGAPSDLSDFQRIVDCYVGINGACTTWQNTTFPNTVSLASDVYDYGTNKAPTYYPPIKKEAAKLVANPNDQTAQQALAAILTVLQKDASTYADRATAAAAEIQDFANKTQASQTTLIGTDGKGGLVKYYDDKYGATSQDVKNATDEIAAQRIILKAANDEYNYDVVVAATTPTYAWVPVVGIIAASVVAGIYGDKAVKALDRARAAQDKINSLADELAADANLMTAINSAQMGMSSIVNDIAAALPVIQKIQGLWSAMADDLGSIVTLIQTDIAQVPPIIMDLGVDEALTAWQNVAALAQVYRLNAYVTVQPSP